MGRIVVAAVYLARRDDLERFVGLMGLQGPGLHARRMGPQEDIIRNVHGILHIPCRMIIGQVQTFEIKII